MNSRTAAATGVSPFFLSHGFNLSPIEPATELPDTTAIPKSPIQQGEAIVRTIQNATDWARASMAYAQQVAEQQANRKRDPAPSYEAGDKVWLKLKNIRTERPCRKLDWKNAKYTVVETVETHAVRLDTPPGVHPTFHVDLVRLASNDPLPSQTTDDAQPPAVIIDDHEEFVVEDILDERRTKRGKGWRLQYKVKWQGYARTTWESPAAMEETQALERWTDRTNPLRRRNGTLDRDAITQQSQ